MGARIRERRTRLGLSQADVARALDIKREAVNAWEHGKNLPKRERWPQLAEILHCSMAWLEFSTAADSIMTDHENNSKPPGPFVAIACIGHQFQTFQYFDEQILHQLHARSENLRCYEIEGPSMEPLFRAGDVVLIDIRRTNCAEPGLFVLDNGYGVVCKWVEYDHGGDVDDPKLRLKSENERFEPYTLPVSKTRIWGRVVWSNRRW